MPMLAIVATLSPAGCDGKLIKRRRVVREIDGCAKLPAVPHQFDADIGRTLPTATGSANKRIVARVVAVPCQGQSSIDDEIVLLDNHFTRNRVNRLRVEN